MRAGKDECLLAEKSGRVRPRIRRGSGPAARMAGGGGSQLWRIRLYGDTSHYGNYDNSLKYSLPSSQIVCLALGPAFSVSESEERRYSETLFGASELLVPHSGIHSNHRSKRNGNGRGRCKAKDEGLALGISSRSR